MTVFFETPCMYCVLWSKRFEEDSFQCLVDTNLSRYKPIFIFQFVVSTTLNAQNVKRNSILAIIYHSSFKTYREAESCKSVLSFCFPDVKGKWKPTIAKSVLYKYTLMTWSIKIYTNTSYYQLMFCMTRSWIWKLKLILTKCVFIRNHQDNS